MDLKNRLHKDIRAVLDQCGHPWEAKPGSTHIKIILAGRMVGIYPLGSSSKLSAMGAQRAVFNTISQIRRTVAELDAKAGVNNVSNDRL